MDKKPQITVIIPCYNVENEIDRCLESLENQTLGNGLDAFQVILIDDCSKDNTFEKLLSWQQKYPKQIEIVKNIRNLRQGAGRNEGLRRAKADYVAFLDADDWVEPEMYESMLEAALIGECDVVLCRNFQDMEFEYCHNVAEKYSEEKDRLILIDSETSRGQMIASNLLGTYCVTKLYSREFIARNNLFFPEGMLYEDVFWMGLLNCYAEKIGILEEKLYHYYMNPKSVSRSRNQSDNRDIIKVNRLLWNEYDKRGLLKGILGEALRYDMLCTYYLTAAKMIFLRYDQIPYEMFYEVQQDMLDMVPDYYFNEYINEYTTQFNILLLGLLDKELTTEDIDSAAESMRIIAKAHEYTRRGGTKENGSEVTDKCLYDCKE